MTTELESIALFDMDGTLCDYDNALFKSLEELRAPDEIASYPPFIDLPPHIQRRSDLIRSNENWWANLPELKLGFDILKKSELLRYRIVILTQGPKKNPAAWAGKKRWIDGHLGEDIDITITRDKGLVYGKVLVDDYPGYIERWLKWRPRGLVIMPVNDANDDYRHNQVIRYDGTNITEVTLALDKARLRE